jgi:hypothetical protein
VATLIGVVGNSLAQSAAAPERAVILTGVIMLAAGAALVALWMGSRGWSITTDHVSFGMLAVTLVMLVATFFVVELRSILYRADILIWSESPFVTDIIKFRSGGTLYDDPAHLSSFNYTPGAPMLTWLIASAAGFGDSVPAYRIVQLLFVAAAAALGTRAIGLLLRLAGVEPPALPWRLIWFPLLFLAGTNTLANNYTYLLHNDALGLLVCAAGFLLVAEQATRPRRWVLVAMTLLPAAGFLVKQSLGIWCALFGAWLLLFERPMRFWRAVAVGGGGLALILLLYGGGIWRWGADFQYWVIEGLGKHEVSPLRSIRHALDGWAFWAVGIAGGLLVIRGPRAFALLGVWLVWFLLFAVETYTSGIAWMKNHMGPGCFLAVLWGAAALPILWPAITGQQHAAAGWRWLRSGLATIAILFAFRGLNMVRIPLPRLSADTERYATALEREFQGLPLASVLLDHGSWLYLPAGIVQMDRGAPAGEAGWTQTADFTGLFSRLRSHHYQRILVRGLHSDEFMYDYSLWEKSSGVRDSLLHYYRESRVIPAVEGSQNPWLQPVSVLEPRSGADPEMPR